MLRVWPWPKTQSKIPPKQALKTCLARTTNYTEYEKEKKITFPIAPSIFPQFVYILIIVICYCAVSGYLHGLCGRRHRRRRCCPTAIVKRPEPEREEVL